MARQVERWWSNVTNNDASDEEWGTRFNGDLTTPTDGTNGGPTDPDPRDPNPRGEVVATLAGVVFLETSRYDYSPHYAPNEAAQFFEGTFYTPKVVAQMANTSDLYHGFPESVRQFQGSATITEITGGDGVTRLRLQIRGSVNGREGHYIWIRNPDGSINHRQFEPSR